ncbi:unnamed protein product [Somion occarium]|uniref:Arginyl-tRNA--protein transferase 1 n=1 Tax=Somion occarium TaxID=3059160 RepID=A0ABP1D340_9APHY
MSSVLSIISPLTPHDGTCGYCGPPGQRSVARTNCHAAELQPTQLSCMTYQQMIDRGWRRSGTYCYKPDLKRSCCPQYTIKLDALQYKPSKSQRKLVNRFNRFVLQGDGDDSMEVDSPGAKTAHRGTQPQKGKTKKQAEFSLKTALHASEVAFLQDEDAKHKFEVTLEPSSYTEEKFNLYQSYQKEIHHENEKKKPKGFIGFLVESPLVREPIPYPSDRPAHLPEEYGSYHQLYRLDGELIGMGIIDILPHCVSSVYFMYNKKWEHFSLGKLSALREVTLAKEIHDAGAPDMQFLYMGFYIHTCQKMRYKGDYSPSYLADPEDYTWHPLEKCRPLLDKYRFACFSHPEHSIAGIYEGSSPDPDIPLADLQEIQLLDSVRDEMAIVKPITSSSEWSRPAVRRAVKTVVHGLGLPLAKEVIFYLAYVL